MRYQLSVIGNDLSDKINGLIFLSEVGLNLVSAERLIDLRGVLFCSYQMCVNPVCFPLSYTHAVWCTDHVWGRLRARREFTSLHKPTVQVNQALSALVQHCIIYISIRLWFSSSSEKSVLLAWCIQCCTFTGNRFIMYLLLIWQLKLMHFRLCN